QVAGRVIGPVPSAPLLIAMWIPNYGDDGRDVNTQVMRMIARQPGRACVIRGGLTERDPPLEAHAAGARDFEVVAARGQPPVVAVSVPCGWCSATKSSRSARRVIG